MRRPPPPTLFPYTTLFRSVVVPALFNVRDKVAPPLSRIPPLAFVVPVTLIAHALHASHAPTSTLLDPVKLPPESVTFPLGFTTPSVLLKSAVPPLIVSAPT